MADGCTREDASHLLPVIEHDEHVSKTKHEDSLAWLDEDAQRAIDLCGAEANSLVEEDGPKASTPCDTFWTLG